MNITIAIMVGVIVMLASTSVIFYSMWRMERDTANLWQEYSFKSYKDDVRSIQRRIDYLEDLKSKGE